ncbi:MAG: tetratricopeptide repeat protein [Calditrichaeota bacterium]|nr:MAG: tetratricopeptide repeat protein [Calditrichota bacterium]
MSELKRIIGTSTFSLLLVVWGLFMVCSGRVPDVNYEDDTLSSEQQAEEDSNSDLMSQLADLDEESTKLEDYQRKEILEALGIDAGGTTANTTKGNEEQDFLTEELFLDLEVEIAELEKLAKQKSSVIDSLKVELQDTDLQLAALERIVGEPTPQFASTDVPSSGFQTSSLSGSEYSVSYQDALQDVYSRRFADAITKFRNLLRQPDTDNLADNCQYWIGECYYGLGDYQQAAAEFEKVFAFDNNNKADDAQFMIGMAYVKMGQPQLAQFELNNLLTFFQNSEYIAKAERELGDLSI